MSESINEDISITDFFCYNDIVVFPLSMMDSIPSFKSRLTGYPVINFSGNMVVVSKVSFTGILTRFNNDSITQVHGLGILDLDLKELIYLYSSDLTVRSQVMKAIQLLITSEFSYKLRLDNREFNTEAQFLVNNGFVNPQYDQSTKSIILHCVPHVPSSVTINAIHKIVSSVRAERASITVVIPPEVADIMARTIHFMNEAAGILTVTNFNDEGEAILGINSDNIIEGTELNVALPTEINPFMFHSHPDRITKEYNVFISWPSGGDLYAITKLYLADNPQIGHFVASPEGLWVIKPTFEFQSLLSTLIKFGLQDCYSSIADAIFKVYSELDYKRTGETSVRDRHSAREMYLTVVSNLTLKQVVKAMPCNIAKKYEDYPLFSVVFIKWKRFSETEKVKITFEYIVDSNRGIRILV